MRSLRLSSELAASAELRGIEIGEGRTSVYHVGLLRSGRGMRLPRSRLRRRGLPRWGWPYERAESGLSGPRLLPLPRRVGAGGAGAGAVRNGQPRLRGVPRRGARLVYGPSAAGRATASRPSCALSTGLREPSSRGSGRAPSSSTERTCSTFRPGSGPRAWAW